MLKRNEQIVLQIGTRDLLGKGMKWSTLGRGGQRSRSHNAKVRFGSLTEAHSRPLRLSMFSSCDGNDAKQRVFLGRLLVALKGASCVVCWL